MIDDTSEMSPGRVSYWNEFYDEENGLLIQREYSNRRSNEVCENGCLLDHYEWFITFASYANILRECILEHLYEDANFSNSQKTLLSVAEPVASEHEHMISEVLEQQCPKLKSYDNHECDHSSESVSLSNVTKLSVVNEKQKCESAYCHHEELLSSFHCKKCNCCYESLKMLHVLHLGCGNSNFCDEFEEEYKTWQLSASVSTFDSLEILNVDICENLIERLGKRFPHRRYAIGNCCELVSSAFVNNDDVDHDHWYSVSVDADNGTPRLCTVYPDSTDLIFDKGTADALMSAFAGCVNPNMESYAAQTLRVLRPGGICFIITINSKEVLEPYFISASVEYHSECIDKCNITSHVRREFDESTHEEMPFSKCNCSATVTSIINTATLNASRAKCQTTCGNSVTNKKGTKYYELCYENVIEITPREQSSVRVETIGSRYNCFAFKVVL